MNEANARERTVPYYACEHGVPGGCAFCNATATPKPRAGEQTPEADAVAEKWSKEHIYMQIEAEHGEIYGHARKLEAERDALAAQNREMANMLTWHVNHEGECLGDHPELLEAARALLAKHGR